MSTSTRYSPEIRELAVRMVFEHEGEHGSQRVAMESIAAKIGCTSETLRKWVRQAERDRGVRAGLSSEKRDQLKALERENYALTLANEILHKASVFLPRRSSTAARSDGGADSGSCRSSIPEHAGH